MFVLSRHSDQSVMLGDDLEVMVLKVRSKRVLLAVYRAVPGPRLMWDASEPRWLDVGDHLELGDDISCHVVDVRAETVRLGLCLPPTITPHRREVYDAIHRESRPRPGA